MKSIDMMHTYNNKERKFTKCRSYNWLESGKKCVDCIDAGIYLPLLRNQVGVCSICDRVIYSDERYHITKLSDGDKLILCNHCIYDITHDRA